MPTLNSQLRQRVSHAVSKHFKFNSSDEARTKPFENMEENIFTNISSGRLELGMERWVGFISWEDQGYSLLGEEAWCAKVRMCLWGRVSGPGYDGSSLCCLIIDSWCDDLSVTQTMYPACFSWSEGWTAIPTKAFTPEYNLILHSKLKLHLEFISGGIAHTWHTHMYTCTYID